MPTLRESRAVRWVVAAVLAMAAAPAANARQPAPQDPSHETRTPSVPGLTAATSLCGTSTDPTYGTTKQNPIKVGGGAMYLASREVKYLSALRGPAGQGLHFKRGGSIAPETNPTFLLDEYTIDYPNIDKPLVLYLDGYHWATPLAPKGWLCGAEMNLAPPRADPLETGRQLLQVAVDLGKADVDPISLDPDGSKTHGVAFDYYRLVSQAARAAAAGGSPLSVEQLPSELRRKTMVAIAYPQTCDGKNIPPKGIVMSDASGGSPPVTARAADADQISKLTSGFAAPAGSIAVAYGVDELIAGAKVTIKYAEPCATVSPEVVLRVKTEAPGVIASVNGTPSPGVVVPSPGAQVILQIAVGPDGSVLMPVYDGGAFEFTDAAIEAVKQWKCRPPLVNGAPILTTQRVSVVVR
jgi:hypothetical protein